MEGKRQTLRVRQQIAAEIQHNVLINPGIDVVAQDVNQVDDQDNHEAGDYRGHDNLAAWQYTNTFKDHSGNWSPFSLA